MDEDVIDSWIGRHRNVEPNFWLLLLLVVDPFLSYETPRSVIPYMSTPYFLEEYKNTHTLQTTRSSDTNRKQSKAKAKQTTSHDVIVIVIIIITIYY